MACDVETLPFFEDLLVIEFDDEQRFVSNLRWKQPLAGRRRNARAAVGHYIFCDTRQHFSVRHDFGPVTAKMR